MSRREFQFVSAGSSKFWAIEMKGNSFDVTFGKIGTAGTTQTKSFADAAAATKAYDKLVTEKTSKGYVEVGSSRPAKAAGKSAGAKAATTKGAAIAGKKDTKAAAAEAVTPLNELYFDTTKTLADFKHLTTFIGQKVVRFMSPKSIKKGSTKVCYCLAKRMDDEDEDEDDLINQFSDLLDAFLQTDAALVAESLVIGHWWDFDDGMSPAAPVIKQLIDGKDRLPNLRALFFGDIERDECEVSWIQQTDYGPVLKAFPKLELLRVRGAEGLQFKNAKHDTLRALAIECGGLSKTVVAQIAKAKFPNLEYLELWLGDRNYGGDSKVNDLMPILKGTAFPKLKHLGLRNCEYADEVAGVMVSAPILKQLESLDLSLGNLSDTGAKALMKLPAKLKLKRLNLQHHYMSNPVMKEIKKLPFTVNVAGQTKPYDWDEDERRYVAIGE